MQDLDIYLSNRQPSGELASASLWASKLASAAAWMEFGTDFQQFNGNVDDFIYILNELVSTGCIWTRWPLGSSALRGVWDPNYFSPPPFTQRPPSSSRSRVSIVGDSGLGVYRPVIGEDGKKEEQVLLGKTLRVETRWSPRPRGMADWPSA